MKKVSNDVFGISIVLESIKKGEIVIFPTDTVYGIGCDPYNQHAVDKIYEIKKREKLKLLPVLGYSRQILENVGEFNDVAKKITDKFWPGSLTIVLPLKDKKLKNLCGDANTLAVRVPNNKSALLLLKECKLIIGTSANISGEKPITDPKDLKNNVPNCDIFLNGGAIKNTSTSTIIQIENDKIKILRKGVISENDLVEAL